MQRTTTVSNWLDVDPSSIVHKTVDVYEYGVRLRSDIGRTSFRLLHGMNDRNIALRWAVRCCRRAGAVPFPARTRYRYNADLEGPGATQYLAIRCLRPTNDYEREVFARITDVAGRTFTYIETQRL